MFMPAPFLARSVFNNIPSKVFHVRGDSYSGSNGTAVSSSNWVNEGSLGGTCSASNASIVWGTNSLNGMPGVKNPVNGGYITHSAYYNGLQNGSGEMTVFAVMKRSGTQGTSSGASIYSNGGVILDAGAWHGIYYNSRSMYLYPYPDTTTYFGSDFDYTDNVAHVVAIRLNASGNCRANFNGVTIYSDATSRAAPSSSATTIRLLKNLNTSNNYGYEFIVSASAMSDSDMDDVVTALRDKWSI